MKQILITDGDNIFVEVVKKSKSKKGGALSIIKHIVVGKKEHDNEYRGLYEIIDKDEKTLTLRKMFLDNNGIHHSDMFGKIITKNIGV